MREPDNQDGTTYLNDEMMVACNTLFQEVEKIHISQKTLGELERSTVIDINVNCVGWTRGAFAIVLDEIASPPRADENGTVAKTEYLLLDARNDVWEFYERATVKPTFGPAQSQVVGAIWDLKKNLYASLESDAFAVRSVHGVEPWHLTKDDASRIIRVPLGLLWLMEHDQVIVSEISGIEEQRHFIVELPNDLNADQALRDLLKGKHRRRRPSRLHRVARGAFQAIRRLIGRAQS